MTTTYYGELVSVIQKYLGPAAERFVRRQVDFHLGKRPESITADDVNKMANSVRIALGLLTQDNSMVDSAVREIKAITKQDIKP